MPILIQVLIDRVLPDYDGHGIVTIMWMFIVLILVQLVSNLILSILSSKWVQMIVINIRNNLLDNCFRTGKILTAQEANLFETLMDNYRKVEERINSEFESKIEWFKVRADKNVLQLG